MRQKRGGVYISESLKKPSLKYWRECKGFLRHSRVDTDVREMAQFNIAILLVYEMVCYFTQIDVTPTATQTP